LLRQLADRPILLYVKGTLEPTDRLAVSIVGARHATPYGRRAAEKLAGALARVGLTVVSGLARGIDGTAHHAALEDGGRTLAVMANGLNSIYPPEHDRLADRIVQQGALLSESPMRLEPRANLFHRRNRIISGLSLGVVVVEATPKSGSIVTAKHALEQNREVFAVPGPIDSLSSQGCHALIKEGAKLVESVDDILDELRVHLTPLASTDPNANPPTTTPGRSLSKNVKITTKTIAAPTQVVSNDEAFLFDLKALQDQDTHPTLNKNETQPDPSSNSHSHNRGASTELVPPGLILSERERIVWETIGTATLHIDAIIAQSGLDPGSAMATLATLELRRLIGRQPGQMFARLR
jgi:DNA processing protein